MKTEYNFEIPSTELKDSWFIYWPVSLVTDPSWSLYIG